MKTLLKERDGKWCSRRIFGASLILFCCGCVIFNKDAQILESIFWGGCSLIGLTTFDIFANKGDK